MSLNPQNTQCSRERERERGGGREGERKEKKKERKRLCGLMSNFWVPCLLNVIYLNVRGAAAGKRREN